mgnify:CR=1 FL=1
MDLEQVLSQYNLSTNDDKKEMLDAFQQVTDGKIINKLFSDTTVGHMYEGSVKGRQIIIFSININFTSPGWGNRFLLASIKPRRIFPVSYMIIQNEAVNFGVIPELPYKVSLEHYDQKISKALTVYTDDGQRPQPDPNIISADLLLWLADKANSVPLLINQKTILFEIKSATIAKDVQQVVEIANKVILLADPD